MKPNELQRYQSLYEQHLTNLKLQGKRPATIDAYSRAVRRISQHFDCCPDNLTIAQLKQYFASLIQTHPWSTIKIDRNGSVLTVITMTDYPSLVGIATAHNANIKPRVIGYSAKCKNCCLCGILWSRSHCLSNSEY